MNILEKVVWFVTNFENESFNNNTDEDWIRIESEMLELIALCHDGNMIQRGLELDIHYVIPYEVRLSLHKKLTEIEPNNKKAIRDYAFYLQAFGDPPDELVAKEMIKRIEEEG